MGYEDQLNLEIKKGIGELEKIEVGSENYKNAVDNVCKLIDKSVELKKVRISRDDKEFENNFKESQIKRDQKEKKIQLCMDAGKIIIPVIVTVWGTLKTFKFEEEGTVTTILGRRHISNLIRK